MDRNAMIADGLYRLIKIEEDHNPMFPSQETVVEVRGGEVINLSTGRGCQLSALGETRRLYGPLRTPYDITPIDSLPRICLAAAIAREPGTQTPADE